MNRESESKYDKSKSMFVVSPPLKRRKQTDYPTVVRGCLMLWLVYAVIGGISYFFNNAL
jgi:hypothetical protein